MDDKEYTTLLKRQIRKYIKEGDTNESILHFFEKINDSYLFFEQDKRLLHHAMQLSNEKLNKKNDELVKVNYSLLTSRERYRNLFEYNQIGIISINKESYITKANGIFSTYLEYSKHELTSTSIFHLISKEQVENVKSQFDLLINGQINHFTTEVKLISKSDKTVFTYAKFFGEYNNQGAFINATATILDVTQNKKEGSILFESILAFENLDRERIAYLLHEEIGQNLATIQLMLQELESNSVTVSNDDKKNEIANIKNLLNTTINEVRSISYKITPEHVTKFGFIPSLYSMAEDIKHKFKNLNLTFYTNINDEIKSTIIQLTLYRVIQEAVNNILKHAQAKNASIQLIRSDKLIALTIEDDGIGFDYEKMAKENLTLGLQSIISRSKSINGDVFIESIYTKGTIIRVELLVE